MDEPIAMFLILVVATCQSVTHRVKSFHLRLFSRWIRHGWYGWNADERRADATSTVDSLTERRYHWLWYGQYYSDAAVTVAATPATDISHAAE